MQNIHSKSLAKKSRWESPHAWNLKEVWAPRVLVAEASQIIYFNTHCSQSVQKVFSTTTGYSSADCDSLSHQLRTPNTKNTLPWNLELQPPHCEGLIVASEIENCRVLISELRVVFSVLTRINLCFTYNDFSTSSDYSLPFHFSLRFRLRCCCSSLPL